MPAKKKRYAKKQKANAGFRDQASHDNIAVPLGAANQSGKKRKANAEASDEHDPDKSSKKHRPKEESNKTDPPGTPVRSRPRSSKTQAVSNDQQQQHVTGNRQVRRTKRIGPKGSTPSPTHPGDSPTFSDDASNYNIDTTKFKLSGNATLRDLTRWENRGRPAKFIRSASGLGSAWVGKRPLGAGNFGIAGLWEKYDDNGNVTEQMVIKQIDFDPNEKSAAKKAVVVESAATGGRQTTNDVRIQPPEEVRIMARMKKTRRPGIVKLINYKRYKTYRKHRIYMEFCPHGDLFTLITRYKRFKAFLPEAFLWDTFHYLVEAALSMYNGMGKIRDGHDVQVVHRDIKPANVFLGGEDTSPGADLPYYPIVRLGDWGLARQTWENDHSNPDAYRGAGTRGYEAPEHVDLKPGERVDDNIKMLSHTNIWEIGATMFELLTLESVHLYFAHQGGHFGELDEAVLLRLWPYPTLMETILRCLWEEPEKRCSLANLRDTIRGHRNRCVIDRYRSKLQGRDNDHESGQEVDTDPDEANRLCYRGNEIEQMRSGKWEAYLSYPDNRSREANEIFRDPELNTLVFPRPPNEPTVARYRDDGPGDDNGDSGNPDNPIYISSNAASAGIDRAGIGGEEEYEIPDSESARKPAARKPAGNAKALGGEPSSVQLRRQTNKRLARTPITENGPPFSQLSPLPRRSASSAARGGANDSYEEGELRPDDDGARQSRQTGASQTILSKMRRTAALALNVLGSSSGPSPPSEEVQGNGADNDGPLTPSASSSERGNVDEQSIGMSMSSGISPAAYQLLHHRSPTEQTQLGLENEGEEHNDQDLNVVRRDHAPQNPPRPPLINTTLPGLRGSMFNRSPNFEPLQRPRRLFVNGPGAGTLDSVIGSYEEAEREGNVDTMNGLNFTFGRAMKAYKEAEENGDWNIVGGLDDMYQAGRRARDARQNKRERSGR